MERVTYILGAGFSAPLGLPLMADFLIRAKDLYFEKKSELEYFSGVLEMIRELHVAKGVFHSNLQNIEEILSILEMEEVLAETSGKSQFDRFVVDVIKHLTPTIPTMSKPLPTANWEKSVFGTGTHRDFLWFVASLFRLRLENKRNRPVVLPEVSIESPNDIPYSIVTLNYDRVLESAVEYVNNSLPCTTDFGFARGSTKASTGQVALAKLHGSVEDERIVPPTWNKALNRAILPDWRLALNELQRANHIRILGYSLPDTDAYVRYLLKAAVIHSEHLKTIHVICLDRTGEVRTRYDEFIDFPFYRFFNSRTEDYLSFVSRHAALRTKARPDSLDFTELESAHARFVADYKGPAPDRNA